MNRLLLLSVFVIFVTRLAAIVPQQINYQGYLTRTDGTPLDTTVAITFAIYSQSSGGTAVWAETQPAITAQGGLFNAVLGTITPVPDAVFIQTQVWLGVTVGNNSEMTPRTRMVSVGYSYRVGTVDGASGGSVSGKINVGMANSNAGNFANVFGQSNVASGDHAVVSGGASNFARGGYSFVGGGGGAAVSDSNSALGWQSVVAGGWRNYAAANRGTVGGGAYNTAGISGGIDATVSGGAFNTATGNGATVSGGRADTASAQDAVIAGGYGNVAAGQNATVGGGGFNRARGNYSVISGGGGSAAGDSNSVSGGYSFIGGGYSNTIVGSASTVGGGIHNVCNGTYAAIPGGSNNRANGNYSFAAGYHSRANHQGAFVWGASSSDWDTTASFNTYTFTVRCQNGARFYTASSGTATGVSLAAGGGSWSSLCDVRQKRLHGDVNTSDVLQKISALPLHRWSYKSQDEKIQHIGPTAQDFRAAFGLGESDTTINTLDPDGIALAAIQELAKQNEELRTAVRGYEERVNTLLTRVQTLEAGRAETYKEGR